MAFPERQTLNVLLTIAVFAVVCGALYSARRIILIFVFAIFFAYLIDPAVRFLQGHSLFFRNLRGPAVVEVYVAFVLLIALLAHAFAPSVVRNTLKLLDETPALLNGLSTGDIATDMRGKYGWSVEQESRLRAFLARHKDDVQGLVRSVDHYLSNAAQVIGLGLLIPILAIFFLRDGDRIANVLIRLFFPTEKRLQIRSLADELHMMLRRYIRAQLILCGFSLVFYTAALILLGFPNALALGALGGALEFVPIVGWVTMFALISAVGIVNQLHWIWMAILLGIWRVIQDYYATPKVMGSELKLHPLAALLAVLAGAEIGGVVGVYLAVPITAAMWLIWRDGADQEPERFDDPLLSVKRNTTRAETPA